MRIIIINLYLQTSSKKYFQINPEFATSSFSHGTFTTMPRPNLRQGLDRDVYAVIKKFEETEGEGHFKSVGQVYDTIKRSNSHLSRQKKRPLEDSIDRVLQFRKEELQDSEDSEAAIEEAEAQLPQKPEDERFLLNRQMTKHWHASTGQSSGSDAPERKKRRIQDESDEKNRQSVGENMPSTVRVNGTSKEDGAEKTDKTVVPKRTPRPNRFHVENPPQTIRLGGVKEIETELSELMDSALKERERWHQKAWWRPRSVLLSGPMGVGKKSLVRSLAARLEMPLVSISPCLADAERMEKSVIEAVDEAMRLAPSIIFIEKVEMYMAKPGSTSHSEHHDRTADLFERQRQRMLQELAPDTHVLIIGTTSNITDIHPSAVFERTLQMRIPDVDAREDIFRVLTEGTDISSAVNYSELAKITHGFVGFDIRNIIAIAQDTSMRRMRKADATRVDTAMVDGDQPEPPAQPLADDTVTPEDLQCVIKDFVPSLRKEGFTVIPNVSWDQVGALGKVRDQLHMSIIGPIKTPDLYESWGLSRPAGVILWGPPGCGKTLVAQAVANEAQASFILINGPELLNKYVGESERAVRELFQRARSSTPCILFFDEMDSLVPRRDGASTDAGVRVVNALLTELDGVQDRSGIYVIGTTNRPDMIDAAMLRPGRLSVRIFVDLPTEDERVDVLRTIFRNLHPQASDAELARLEPVARDPRCHDFSGADLGGLHIKAAECGLGRWLRKEKTAKEIDNVDWEHALATTTKSVLNPESYRKLDMKLGKEK